MDMIIELLAILRDFTISCWNSIMNNRHNPLRNAPINLAHMVMQVLAWMWCIVFSLSVGSYFVFGVSAIAHTLFIVAIIITVSTFKSYEGKNDKR